MATNVFNFCELGAKICGEYAATHGRLQKKRISRPAGRRAVDLIAPKLNPRIRDVAVLRLRDLSASFAIARI